jgi:inner membrane protein
MGRMDNVCHTLLGAAIGEAGLKRLSPRASATLLIASNIPDLDALVFFTGTPSVSFRRGWTHGVLAQALLPIVLTAAVVWFDGWRCRRRGEVPRVDPLAILALSYVGVFAHLFLDFLNNYGIRLLMPFSGRWFYGDAVFIVDPWLWLILGAGVFLARRMLTLRPAQAALVLVSIYIAGMLWLAVASRRIVLEAWTTAHGAAPPALMVGPVPIDPLRKQIIVDAGNHYETGELRWWPREVRFDRETTPKNDEFIMAAHSRRNPTIQAVLVWARFPYYQITSSGETALVTLRDMRFGDRVGGVTVEVR